MAPTSTSRQRQRPLDYRTPSPPPYSPIVSPIDGEGHHDLYGTRQKVPLVPQIPNTFALPQNYNDEYSGKTASSTNVLGRSGHRSARSMDAFASIALATQYATPSAAARKRALEAPHYNESAKRLKSQQTPFEASNDNLTYNFEANRLTSSGPQMEDAQLLLDFVLESRAMEVKTTPDEEKQAFSQLVDDSDLRTGEDTGQVPDGLSSVRYEGPDNATTEPANAPQTVTEPRTEDSPVSVVQLPSDPLLVQPSPPNTHETAQKAPEHVSAELTPSTPIHLEPEQPKQPIQDVLSVNTFKRSASEPSGSQTAAPDRALRSSSELPARPNDDSDKSALTKAFGPRKRKVSFVDGLESFQHDSIPLDTAQDQIIEGEATEQLEPATNQSAVCAACSFAKNSLNIDSDHGATSWINCDGCKSWFHFACAGFKTEREVRAVDKFRCKKCKPLHGSTSYVRKSSRAHASIDYAGLHQGVIKSSDDRPEHHYIAAIKSGVTSFQEESFPRMSPELVTAEYFEKGAGMREPVVIPVSLNPRPRYTYRHGPEAPVQTFSPKKFGIDESANLEEWLNDTDPSRVVPDDHQDGLDMVMPEGLTVRKVAELYGADEKIEVIDVKSQNGESRKWTMKRWADYYESKTEAKVIRNVISLEVSRSRLGKLIRRPQIVRDFDLQDSVWPEELANKGEFPNVQFYCLMSVADCFTDFHIDFGGSSVFYHILKGSKTFLFIPPKEKHLKKYEEWCKSPAQNWTFLPDQTKECYRVDLTEGDTMLIPSGWIHAVWTPEDSLVIGGNFLTRLNYGMQFRVHQIEKATGVARKFRYPHFQKLHWFTVFQYLEKDPLPSKVRDLLQDGLEFERNVPTSHEFNEWGENSRSGPENYHARYYSQAELDGLPELVRYILRTVLIDNGSMVDGISADVRNAVKKSIPRSHGDPAEVTKTFAIWCAWKRGNEPIPPWAYPDAEISGTASDKMSAAVSRKLAEEAASKAPRRQSQRMQAQKESAVSTHGDNGSDEVTVEIPLPESSTSAVKRTFEQREDQSAADADSVARKRPRLSSGSAGSQRKTACDTCRRRRRACKHKDVGDAGSNVSSDIAPSNLVHKEALLNGSALQEKLSSLGGLFNALKSEGSQNAPANALASADVQMVDSAFDHTSTATFASPNGSAMPFNDDFSGDASIISDTGGGPRPRTKACNHCRKSKRRCIHDAFGNEDPVKVAESAVPRPHARKLNKGDHIPRSHGGSPDLDQPYAYDSIFDQPGVAAPPPGAAPMANMVAMTPIEQSNHIAVAEGGDYSVIEMDRSDRDALLHTASAALKANPKQDGHTTVETDVLDPMLRHGAFTASIISAESGCQNDAFDRAASTLVSPPTSSDDALGGSPPKIQTTPLRSQNNSRKSSPTQNRHFQRHTPESGPTRKPSRAPSQGHHSEQDAASSKKRRSLSVPEADEESLKLIKELQAQDLGLRRRGKV